VKWLEPAGGFSTRYSVSYNGGSHSVNVLHADHSYGDWVLLGNYEFAAPGGPLQGVTLSGNNFNDSGWEGTFLEADAVKFVPTFAPEGAFDLRYIISDHLGTPQRVTDEAGTVVWSANYRPFGAATVDEDADGDLENYSLNLRFPGQYFDAESGLHYNYFRDYDPSLGRYIESDPIGLRGGANTFGYSYSNPILHSDYYGLFPVPSWVGPAGEYLMVGGTILTFSKFPGTPPQARVVGLGMFGLGALLKMIELGNVPDTARDLAKDQLKELEDRVNDIRDLLDERDEEDGPKQCE
jgi:RHS repeat-associated protein